jgi:hypothetical protein
MFANLLCAQTFFVLSIFCFFCLILGSCLHIVRRVLPSWTPSSIYNSYNPPKDITNVVSLFDTTLHGKVLCCASLLVPTPTLSMAGSAKSKDWAGVVHSMHHSIIYTGKHLETCRGCRKLQRFKYGSPACMDWHYQTIVRHSLLLCGPGCPKISLALFSF